VGLDLIRDRNLVSDELHLVHLFRHEEREDLVGQGLGLLGGGRGADLQEAIHRVLGPALEESVPLLADAHEGVVDAQGLELC